MIQILTLYVWFCIAFGYLYQIQDNTCLKQQFINSMLGNTLSLEPLNSFFYTWRCLDGIQSTKKGISNTILKIFRLITIILIPLVNGGLYLFFSFYDAKLEVSMVNNNFDFTNQ